MSTKEKKPAQPKQAEATQSSGDAALLSSLAVVLGVFAVVYAVTMSNSIPFSLFSHTTNPTAPIHMAASLADGPKPARKDCDEDSWSIKNMKMTPVEVVEWDPSVPFTKQLVTWREPVILKNTFVKNWKALEKWSDDNYLKSQPHMKIMNNTMLGTQCAFAGFAPAPLEKVGVKRLESFQFVNISSEEFFGGWTNVSDPKYYFWYGKVEGQLRQDVSPSHNLWIDSTDEDAFGLFMWLSGPGIGPWLHFDQDHNFYVQVSGTKRFILIPPWEYSKLYMYPRVHPNWHKSQVDFDRPDFEKFPAFANVTALVANLVPGDVLHVPAYWWHHVRSRTRSVSLASWSQSGIYRKMRYGLYERSMLFDRIKDPAERRAAFVKFVNLLSTRMYGSAEAGQRFLSHLFESRWKSLARLFTDIPAEEVCPPKSTATPSEERLEADVVYAAEKLENCQTKWENPDEGIGINRQDMRAIRDMEFGDYIEFVLAELVPLEHLYSFVERCLVQP